MIAIAFGFTIFWTIAYYTLLAWMPSFTQRFAGLTPSQALWSNTIGLIAMVISQTTMVAVMTMTPLHMKDHGQADLSAFVIAVHIVGMYGLVLVVGDLIADEFIYGEVARVSREAPVLILKYDATEMVAGGAGTLVLRRRATV